ncbi:MAG: peptidylprolyl isomerase [Gemmatimonadaceae bacterium]
MTARSSLRRGVSQCLPLLILGLAPASHALAQHGELSRADSALVGRILLAEDRRDSTDGALAVGRGHTDPRIRMFTRRAAGRIRDSAFSARDSFAPLPAPPRWPDASWRSRYRALSERGSDCRAIRAAFSDRSWQVRLRAADLVMPTCSVDDSLLATLRHWIDSVPADVSHRDPGGISWHAAAHALVALSKLKPGEAAQHVLKFAAHRQWHLRLYSARAAAILADAATLRILARDTDPNVAESAIDALGKLTKHADDSIFVAALKAKDAQVVRVAALALAGSTHTDAAPAAAAAFPRWVNRANASERDVRLALLAVSGRPASDDRPPVARAKIPPDAIALALGADIRLRITIAPASGGGSFTVRMRGDVAPMTAGRILALARAGYYNGHSWHRVEHDFVIQGGSPGANEYVGNDRYFRDELGTVPHVRGTVGMSTRGHDTGDAQWFVNLRDNPRLQRDYTVFAEVVDGMNVIDGILEGDVIGSIARATRR